MSDDLRTTEVMQDNAEHAADDLVERLNDPHRRLCLSDRQESAAEITKLRGLIKGIVDAYDSGNLEMRSPEVGEPDVGIPMHEWHEEWLHYARGTFPAADGAKP